MAWFLWHDRQGDLKPKSMESKRINALILKHPLQEYDRRNTGQDVHKPVSHGCCAERHHHCYLIPSVYMKDTEWQPSGRATQSCLLTHQDTDIYCTLTHVSTGQPNYYITWTVMTLHFLVVCYCFFWQLSKCHLCVSLDSTVIACRLSRLPSHCRQIWPNSAFFAHVWPVYNFFWQCERHKSDFFQIRTRQLLYVLDPIRTIQYVHTIFRNTTSVWPVVSLFIRLLCHRNAKDITILQWRGYMATRMFCKHSMLHVRPLPLDFFQPALWGLKSRMARVGCSAGRRMPCPYHLTLCVAVWRDAWSVCSLSVLLWMCCCHLMPSFLLRALVSKPSSLATEVLFSSQVFELYRRTEMTEAL